MRFMIQNPDGKLSLPGKLDFIECIRYLLAGGRC